MATERVPRHEPIRRDTEVDDDRSRHLAVVGPGARPRTQFRLTPKTGVTLTALMFGALFGVAVSHALLIQSQLRIDEMDKEVADEQARYEQLRLDVAELESPDRIIADARELGMVEPAETVWLTPDPAEATGTDDGEAEDPETPDTSYEEVKPYLGSTP